MLEQIRPNAVALVDAFDLTDHVLNSALGRKDGKVYEALYDMAHREPLNQAEVAEGFKKHLQPLMKASRLMFSSKL
eukprot:m.52896 g.52896  ORF g.52896 m.52896 type:complete len:76 (-) comp11340_c0_seq6:180-407(-)